MGTCMLLIRNQKSFLAELQQSYGVVGGEEAKEGKPDCHKG